MKCAECKTDISNKIWFEFADMLGVFYCSTCSTKIQESRIRTITLMED